MIEDEYYRDSIVRPGEFYRLRRGENIVGYMNVREGGHTLYSRDNYGWTNVPIEFNEKDRSTYIFDANRQMIFEHDVIRFRRNVSRPYLQNGWIVYDKVAEKLIVKLLEEDRTVALEAPSPQAPFRDDVKVVSQLY